MVRSEAKGQVKSHHDCVASAGDVFGEVEVHSGSLQADDTVRPAVRGAWLLCRRLLVLVEDQVGGLQHHESLCPVLSVHRAQHTVRNKLLNTHTHTHTHTNGGVGGGGGGERQIWSDRQRQTDTQVGGGGGGGGGRGRCKQNLSE